MNYETPDEVAGQNHSEPMDPKFVVQGATYSVRALWRAKPRDWEKPCILSALVLSLACCGPGCGEDPFCQTAFDPYGEDVGDRVSAYFIATTPSNSVGGQREPSIYVDFSNGMVHAYKGNPSNSNVMKAIGQKFIDPKVNWYRLGDDSIKQLNSLANYQLYNMVTDANSFSKDIMAPLQRTLERIVSDGREALFITDFEEYSPSSREEMLGYGKDHFKRWLQAGNKLSVFANDYVEKGVTKRLFFLVFSHGQGAPNGLLDKFKQATGGVFDHAQFDLTNQAWSVTNHYPKEGVGGIWYNSEAGDAVASNVFELDNTRYINGLAKHGRPFEFYPIDLPWSYVKRTAEAEKGEDKDFLLLGGLKLDVSNNSAFELKDMELEVRDVTADYEHFARCMVATQHVPRTEKDPVSGNMRFHAEEDDPIALECYEPDGRIKDRYKYTPVEHPLLKEVLTFGRERFINGLNDPKAVDLMITDLHPSFDASKLSSTRLLRVDMVIKAVQDRSQDGSLDRFKWDSLTKKGDKNESLYYSIKETLQDPDLSPERAHRVLYTYFILTPAER